MGLRALLTPMRFMIFHSVNEAVFLREDLINRHISHNKEHLNNALSWVAEVSRKGEKAILQK